MSFWENREASLVCHVSLLIGLFNGGHHFINQSTNGKRNLFDYFAGICSGGIYYALIYSSEKSMYPSIPGDAPKTIPH